MDSPFDNNPSQHPNGTPRPEAEGASEPDRDEYRGIAHLGSRVPLTRVEAMPAAAGPQAAGGVAYARTLTESTVVWRNQQAAGRSVSRNDWLLGVVASACISACVSVLAMWLWGGQGQAASPDLVDAMTVTYEPLEPSVAPQQGTIVEPSQQAEADDPVTTRSSLARDARAVPRREAAVLASNDRAPVTLSRRSGFVVITEPEGAHVTINGVGYGTSPVNIRYLPPGARRVRATKSGYETEERFLGAEVAGSTANLRIVLREASTSREPQ
jgi:hypothetical protein